MRGQCSVESVRWVALLILIFLVRVEAGMPLPQRMDIINVHHKGRCPRPCGILAARIFMRLSRDAHERLTFPA